MTEAQSVARAERVAARATGVGVGLLVFMTTWLVAARITERLWGPPSAAVVAMTVALLAGVVSALVAGHRLAHGGLGGSPLDT